MPKLVDHHERRTRIADALFQVAATDGIEAVSLRHVAAAAGVTTGMVQHYFRTKEEMLLFALDVIGERVQARVEASTARGTGAMLRELLVQQLPFDEPRRAELRVALAFQAYAVRSPAIAARLREGHERLRDVVAGQIRQAQAAGEASRTLDPHASATGLVALVEGLGGLAASGSLGPEEALAAFDAHLSTLFRQAAAGAPPARPRRRTTGRS
ncbi:TetR/AcrR family transcriptional regulator [Amycolatopsis suaedae]|uniref:TetR family transcriptional regulator n=1 Tax=Amycolatopsis suaedae TaxID=2510978 RepID=A0A4Q7J9B2_9PSEU|nr:TetR/AcrR family transcriptional regulator [Amycolatopsis suaedae]RZQ63516.1 TetR family transcriptional regulator [Amycolatopsis suaedae]